MVRFSRQRANGSGASSSNAGRGWKTCSNISKCADTVIPYGIEIPPFDVRLSLISLPRVLGVTLDTIPNRTPYLRAPVLRTAAAGATGPAESRAGLGGQSRTSPGRRTFAPVGTARAHFAGAGRRVLQFATARPRRATRRACKRCPPSIHSGLKLADFLDTASVIAEMDLVISVDTAVAHLAGALGKPVWIFIQHSPDWRWFLDRPDSPWYPTAQLFRQTERDEWKTPILRVAEALKRKTSQRSAVNSQ